jgi:two-component system LytT family response regulator
MLVVAECNNRRDTVSALRQNRANLVILDIQMPGMNGFEVLRQLSPGEVPVVIFATAYDQYALRAPSSRLGHRRKPW